MENTVVKKKFRLRSRNPFQPFTIVDVIIGFILLLLSLIIIFPFYSGLMQSIVPQTIFRRSGFILIPPKITRLFLSRSLFGIQWVFPLLLRF